VRQALEAAVGEAGRVTDCLESPAEGALRMARALVEKTER